MKNKGVYFSASDSVYEWAIAFLNSFRKYNPEMPVYLIPFNDDCARILSLQNQYDFLIYEDKTLFDQLEAIGQQMELGLTATGRYWFRRYSSFWGPLDHFIYLDARQLVLSDLESFFKPLDRGFDFAFYDCALNQVYEEGVVRDNFLLQGRARGFLSGLWSSKKGVFDFSDFEKYATEIADIRAQLNPRNTDQAFINYCCDRKGVRYVHVAELDSTLVSNCWALKQHKIYSVNAVYHNWSYGDTDHKKKIILLHWAGIKLSAIMPHRILFLKFRHLNSDLAYWIALVMDVFKLPLLILFRTVRTNRFINLSYHSLRGMRVQN